MAHNQGGDVTFSPEAKCSEHTYTYPVFGDQVFLMLTFPDVTMSVVEGYNNLDLVSCDIVCA